MSTLSELYITMENLRKLNLPIEEKLKQEAAKLEEDLIRKEILPTITKKIEPALTPVQRELVLVVDYVPGEPLKVSISREREILETIEDFVEIKPDPEVEHKTYGPQKSGKRDIAPATGLRVIMPDGKIIACTKAKDTFIDAITALGIDRVRSLGLKLCNVPIISNTRDKKYGSAQQDVGNGWLIMTHCNTADKKKLLERMAKALKIDIRVEIM